VFHEVGVAVLPGLLVATAVADPHAEAGDTVGQLIDDVGEPGVLSRLKKLAKLVDQYDYDSAQALLDELMA
jgi:hypothetical protein